MVSNHPVVECEVTFLSEKEGGRKFFGNRMLLDYQYRPHVVVGNINQRNAILDENKSGLEEYLGVAFCSGPEIVEPNMVIKTEMALIYFPKIKYEELVLGTTFTIREGAKVVGFGTVVRRKEAE